MAQHGKRYRQARAQIDREQVYPPVEAIRMLKSFDSVKTRPWRRTSASG